MHSLAGLFIIGKFELTYPYDEVSYFSIFLVLISEEYVCVRHLLC